MNVTIIGTGKMARAIGARALAGGHSLTVLGKEKEQADALAAELDGDVKTGTSRDPIDGDVVVLAVYYPGPLAIVEQYGEQLAGKVVVEISNPIDFETMDGLVIPPDSSAAEEVAKAAADGAKVVKAFNTTFGNTLVEGKVGGLPLDVFIAGDDEDAKAKVAELAEGGGLVPIDVGPLRRARQLEQLGFLHVTVQEPLGTGYASAVKIIKP